MRTFNDIETWLKERQGTFPVCRKKKQKYYNIPAAFDIETTSFRDKNDEPCGTMYLWAFGIDDTVFYGRTWSEYAKFIVILHNYLDLDDIILPVYVHNLEFEFQWIMKRHEFVKVFAIKKHRPIYALTSSGIEYRCSYLLSGLSLAKVGENLQTYKCEKLTGDLDYSLLRHSKTPMTEKELTYSHNDIAVLLCYIKEQIEQYGKTSKIPLTKTGKVRNYTRSVCMAKGKYGRYHDMIRNLTLDREEYEQAKRAFQGGFTHANAWKVKRIVHDVDSFDFISAYPAVMVAEKRFPMTAPEIYKPKDAEDFKRQLDEYACIFDVEVWGLTSAIHYEHMWSSSKCRELTDFETDNGRLVSAGHFYTTMTELDFEIFRQAYDYESIVIRNFRRMRRGYLPTDFVKAILKLYKDKTELKGVAGKELEYLNGKEMLNSMYGMSVTDPCRPSFPFADGEWQEETEPDIEKDLERYNNSKTRFLYYYWGIWVTALCRRNLFTAIAECKGDYVYSDTDSVKITNAHEHIPYFEKYNAYISAKIEKALEHHGIDPAEARPKTIKGVEKPLGIWEWETKGNPYTRFKTLGAKRYLYEQDGHLTLTVAGVNKNKGADWLAEQEDPFNLFDDELFFPPEATGKNIHYYIDDERSGTLRDYTGRTAKYNEKSAICLEPTGYDMSAENAFVRFLMGLEEWEIG